MKIIDACPRTKIKKKKRKRKNRKSDRHNNFMDSTAMVMLIKIPLSVDSNPDNFDLKTREKKKEFAMKFTFFSSTFLITMLRISTTSINYINKYT